jgi:hypothetical protein
VAVTCAAPADALDITFDDVMSVGNPLVTVLETAGYRFTAASDGALLSASYSLGSGLASFAHFVVPASWQSLDAVTFAGLLAAGASGALALDDIRPHTPAHRRR